MANTAHEIDYTDSELDALLDSIGDKYEKPSTGIPKTDLASAVQTSLSKADTALQSYTETDPTVPSWAKASSKPSYTASEVGAVPTTRTVNGKALSADITLSSSDVSALPASTSIPSKTSDLTNDSGYITSADISGVYKYKGSKTNYSNLPTTGNVTGDVWNVVNAYGDYPAGTNFAWDGTTWDALGGSVDLSGYVPTSRTVNGKALSSNISLSASDVSALPSSTYIPTKTSDLTNDSDFITSADIPEGAAPSTTTPKMDGTAAVGTETKFARGDHRHPTDTSRQAAITLSSKLSADLIEDGTTNKTVTSTEKSTWNSKGTYSKPSGGIPATDLASAVQTSLGKADTALQSYTESDPVFTASAAHGISSTDISNWNAKGTYSKPSGGIPKTDLASAVQTSLGKADTALQSYTETDPVFAASVAADITSSDISNWNSKTSNIGTITGIKMNGASKGTSGVVDLGTVITAHQDISGKADKSTTTTAGTYKSITVNASGIVTGGSNPTTLAGYGITDAASSADLANYLPLAGGTMTGSVTFNAVNKGIYLTDSNNSTFAGIIQNADNLWIGAQSTLATHHTGGTYISAGSEKVYISRLVEGTRTNYGVLDAGNTYISSGKGYINNNEITTISGNASTATALQTARNIWGQSFSGDGDIKDTLYMIASGANVNSRSAILKFNSAAADSSSTTYRSPYIQAIPATGGSTYGRKRLSVFQSNATNYTDAFNEVFTILPEGSIQTSSTLGETITLKTTRGTYACIAYQPNNGVNWSVGANANTYYFWNATANAIVVSINTSGDITCKSVIQSSDETLKNKVGDINIKVEDIAAAPNVKFTWKEGEDTKNIHGGTYAQYWEKVTPYYVHGEEGNKSLDYASLAVSCSIELAKEVVALKEENAQLKKELAEIKKMINKLNK